MELAIRKYKMSLVTQVGYFLGIDEDEVVRISELAPRTYKRYTIPKRQGGTRTIHQPTARTKALQYSLIELLYSAFPVSDIACAYRKGISSPLRKVAQQHASYKYSIRIDFKDFFHSIGLSSLQSTLNESSYEFDSKDLSLITKSTFLFFANKYRLAIGAPSSPIVSNLVLYDLDEAMNARASGLDPGATVSRYADDILFSTNLKGTCGEYYSLVVDLLKETKNPHLRINEKKTCYMSRGTRRRILGLIVTPQGSVGLGRSRRRLIKHLLHQRKLDHLDESERLSLRGMLAFVKDVEPDFINVLSHKYGAELVNSARMAI